MIFAHISPPGHLQMSFDIHGYPPVTGELRSLISCPSVKNPQAMAYLHIKWGVPLNHPFLKDLPL